MTLIILRLSFTNYLIWKFHIFSLAKSAFIKSVVLCPLGLSFSLPFPTTPDTQSRDCMRPVARPKSHWVQN